MSRKRSPAPSLSENTPARSVEVGGDPVKLRESLNRAAWVDSEDDLESPGGSGGTCEPITESVPQLREEMLHRLVRIARLEEQRPRGRQTAVVAVRTFLELTEPRIRDAVLRLLNGNEAHYEAWLRAEIAQLEAKRKESA